MEKQKIRLKREMKGNGMEGKKEKKGIRGKRIKERSNKMWGRDYGKDTTHPPLLELIAAMLFIILCSQSLRSDINLKVSQSSIWLEFCLGP